MKNPTTWLRASGLMMILVLFPFAPNGICQEESPAFSLTRAAAINMAIRNNIDLRVQALDSSLAENSIKGSKGIYNPFLTASIDYARTNVAGEDFGTETTSGYLAITQTLPTGASVSLASQTGPTSAFADPLYDYTDWSTAIGINIYQPLLKNAGKTATELGITQNIYTYQESLETFRENVIDTVFSVISEYNRLYVLRQLLQAREDAVRSAQQLLDELRTKPSPGGNPEIELANVEYALSQRQTELIEAERQVSSKEATLRYLIGMADKTRITPVDPPSRDEPPETEDQAIALALEHRPDLENLRIQLQANEVQRKVAKRNMWPDFAVTASGGYRGYAQDGGFNDTVTQIGDGKGRYWATGLRFTYPLGNDLAESEYRQSKTRSDQLQSQIIATEWQVRDTIREDNRSLLSARLQVQGTSKSRVFAEQRVDQYQKNRRRGTASVKDLLDAESDLINARNLELNAIESFAFLVARLWKDIGVLLERQNIYFDLSRPEQLGAGSSPEVLPESGPPVAK